jgi:hypothetical protein
MPHHQKQATAPEQTKGRIRRIVEDDAASLLHQADCISPSLDRLSDESLLHALAGGAVWAMEPLSTNGTIVSSTLSPIVWSPTIKLPKISCKRCSSPSGDAQHCTLRTWAPFVHGSSQSCITALLTTYAVQAAIQP